MEPVDRAVAAGDPSAVMAELGLDLAAGKYNDQISQLDKVLSVAAMIPGPIGVAALVAKKALDGFIELNRLTAPAHVVPDGRGGWVPADNSRFDPKTGEFI
jgi:hypothetical protein